VYDGVGKDTWASSLEAIKMFGKAVFIGSASQYPGFDLRLSIHLSGTDNTGGPIPPVPLDKLVTKNISLMRPTLRNFIRTRARLEQYGTKAFDMVKEGKWKVLKHHRYYSLAEVDQAHRDLENRSTRGKLLIKL
jgi:NADPH2:quinone reductase